MTNYINLLEPILESFASSPIFTIQMGEIFGADQEYNSLQESWLDGSFTLPTVTVISSSELKSAMGGLL